MRRYEHVDVTKDFELRSQKRETEKLQKLEELYEKHDRQALEIRALVQTSEQQEAMAVLQEEAHRGMMQEMRAEREALVQHFDKDKDLQEKMLIQGVS